MATLNIVILCVGAIPFIVVPFLIFNWFRFLRTVYTRNKQREKINLMRIFPFKSVGLFIIQIIFVFILSGAMESLAREKVIDFLRGESDDVLVIVDSKTVQDARQVVNELSKVAPMLAHHSHPTVRIHITIKRRNETLALQLGRDSDISQEYWVFYPEYYFTSINEIGRIRTKIFDNI